MRRLIIVSGAGLSADSGVPTFRKGAVTPLWDKYKLTEVCNIQAFDKGFHYLDDPMPPLEALSEGSDDEPSRNLYELTHEFYNMRRQELGTVEPNIAHLRIAEWYERFPGQVVNFTTNVDDLLERAGIPHDDVIHAHGYLTEIMYRRGKDVIVEDIGYTAVDYRKYKWVKPAITFFGETAPWYMGQINLFDTLTTQDLVIVVGASNQVIDFNWELFPAHSRGTKVWVVNNGINYLEQSLYEERGIPVWYDTAANVFSNKHFIGQVEAWLEEKIYVPSR